MADRKRPTVTVNCAVANGVQLRRHVAASQPFAPQMPDGEGVVLKAGQNAGIDKEWFDNWREENKNLSLVTDGLITAVDDNEDPENSGQQESALRKEATMDHDVMHRHVQGLVKFKDRYEKVLEWAEAQMKTGAPVDAAEEPIADRFAELKREIADLAEQVSAVQVSKDGAAQLSAKVDDLLAWFEANREALELVLSVGDEVTGETGVKGAAPDAGAGTGAAASQAGTDTAQNGQAPQPAPQPAPEPGSQA